MKSFMKVWWYGGLLILFGLFAVYSTSIWKSFDQRLSVIIVQNIETVKTFSSFLEETLVAATQKVVGVSLTANLSGENSSSLSGEQEQTILSEIDINNDESSTPLVIREQKKIQKRNNYVLFVNQLRSLVIAVLMAICALCIPLSFFKEKKLVILITIGVFLFQLCVFIPGIAATNGTARGWVDIPGLPNMQPAEFFKLGYVFFMSYWLTKKKNSIEKSGFLLQFGVINAIILLVILAIPDFGTLFILALTGTIMAWYEGLQLKKIGLLGGIAGLVAGLGILVIGIVMPNNYAFSRLTTFLDRTPEVKKERELREGRQIQQGLMAIGAGGFLGQGYGKGLQKMGQLPEAYSDMIFAAFSEEIGFVGNMLLFALYLGLFIAVLRSLSSVKDPQLKILAVGIISLIVIQVFVHIGVNLEVLPNTGLTLPFISHGGTALMINLIELALLYKILRGK